jgi:hypothetical protein
LQKFSHAIRAAIQAGAENDDLSGTSSDCKLEPLVDVSRAYQCLASVLRLYLLRLGEVPVQGVEDWLSSHELAFVWTQEEHRDPVWVGHLRITISRRLHTPRRLIQRCP